MVLPPDTVFMHEGRVVSNFDTLSSLGITVSASIIAQEPPVRNHLAAVNTIAASPPNTPLAALSPPIVGQPNSLVAPTGWPRAGSVLPHDLIPLIFASLQLEDAAAACVCLLWRQAWAETKEIRRNLHLAPLGEPDFDEAPLGEPDFGAMAAHSRGDWLCWTNTSGIVTFVSPAMLTLRQISVPVQGPWLQILSLAVGDERIFFTTAGHVLHDGSKVVSVSMDGETIAEHEDGGVYFEAGFQNLLLHGDVLFARREGDGEFKHVVALDASTLQVRFRIDSSHFATPTSERGGMAVAGNELFICDPAGFRLQVFSLTGEHLREVYGAFRQPCNLLHFDGRLYLTEMIPSWEHGVSHDDDGTWTEERRAAGRRLFVLTPQGQTLQVWSAPGPVRKMTILGHKLVVNVHSSLTSSSTKLVALWGL